MWITARGDPKPGTKHMEWEGLSAEIPSRWRTWAVAGAKAEGGAAGTQQEGAQKGPLRCSGGCCQLGEHPMDKPHRRERWVEVLFARNTGALHQTHFWQVLSVTEFVRMVLKRIWLCFRLGKPQTSLGEAFLWHCHWFFQWWCSKWF